jgi:serine/threonine protein phosphatase PrpC
VPGKGEDKWLLSPHNVFGLLSSESEGDDSTTTTTTTSFSAYGVFDGHGGKAASAFAARHLLPHVARAAERCSFVSGVSKQQQHHDKDAETPPQPWLAQDALAASLPWALKEGFASADAECRRRFPTSGTTATLAVQCGFYLVVGSVGDSHAFLDTGREVVQMSGNHRLEDSPSERARVLAEGGEFFFGFGRCVSSVIPPLPHRSKQALAHFQCELSCQKRCQNLKPPSVGAFFFLSGG